MVQIEGSYQHEKNENLDGYFTAVGVPFIPRKMMAMTSPLVEIQCEEEKWTIKTITLLRTHQVSFVLGEEYEETMPSGDVLKCVTTKDGDTLITVSHAPNGAKVTRTYTFSDNNLVLTMHHEQSGEVAKRFFKRV